MLDMQHPGNESGGNVQRETANVASNARSAAHSPWHTTAHKYAPTLCRCTQRLYVCAVCCCCCRRFGYRAVIGVQQMNGQAARTGATKFTATSAMWQKNTTTTIERGARQKTIQS